MRPATFAAASLAALALGACQPSNDAGAPAAEPATAPAAAAPRPAASAPIPAAFAGALDARGTEPFWALAIRADRITLSRPDHPDRVAANPGPTADAAQATWDAQAGAPMTVRLQLGPCSDGMSDAAYPLSAEVTTEGETLKGCAAKAGAASKAD